MKMAVWLNDCARRIPKAPDTHVRAVFAAWGALPAVLARLEDGIGGGGRPAAREGHAVMKSWLARLFRRRPPPPPSRWSGLDPAGHYRVRNLEPDDLVPSAPRRRRWLDRREPQPWR